MACSITIKGASSSSAEIKAVGGHDEWDMMMMMMMGAYIVTEGDVKHGREPSPDHSPDSLSSNSSHTD